MSYVSPMKRTLLSLTGLILILNLSSCLKPDAIFSGDRMANVSFVDVLETGAYARDVFVAGNSIFVAASQAGNQIWQEQEGAMVKVFEPTFDSNPLDDDPALRITVDPVSRLMFTFDKSGGHYKKLNANFDGFDSVYVTGDCIGSDENDGVFGSGGNEDFIAKQLNDSLVAVYVIDKTSNDGFKQYFFNRRLSEPNIFGCEGGYYYWEANNVGSPTYGHNLGMDMKDTLIAISHDEIGVGLYRLDVVDLDTLAVVNTPGETIEVKFYENYLLCANNWAGMGIFSLGQGDSSLTHLADIEVDGWVKQISLWNNMAILSCGENGIFLVNLSDPENPIVDQPIDAGYTYRTFVSGDMIYAATREGVKRYHIESR